MAENTLLWANLLKLLSILGRGYESFRVISFRRRKSTHQRVFPFFFCTGINPKDQGEFDGSMTPCRSQVSICSFRLASM